MALFLTEDDVRTLLPMEQAIEALHTAFLEQGNGTGVNSPRGRVQAGQVGVTMMVAALGGQGIGGFKTMGAGKAMVLLFGGEPYGLQAVIEAGRLGAIRTGAASGLATRHMAREDASTVGMIGTGNQARTQLAAVCTVRPIKTVKVFSRNQERREEFSQRMSESLAVDVQPVGTAREAVEGTDIVAVITNVRGLNPVLFGDWLEPGMHINAAGANSLGRQELDVEAMARSAVIVADAVDQAKIECDDLVQAVAAGRATWESVLELGQVVAGKASGRGSRDDITLFESQGIALEDVAVASHIYQRALAEGRGQQLPF